MSAQRAPASATGTVNPQEVARFDALAATWWDPEGPMWPLHRLNALRWPFIVAQVQRHLTGTGTDAAPLAGLRVLDVGCAAGLLSEALAKQGARVTGIDPSTRNIAIARRHAAAHGLDIEYLDTPLEALPDRQFDVVLNMEVVEHVEDLPDFMARCCAATRPGGLQFVATINRNPLSWLVAIVGAEYVLRWLPRGTHRWRKFVTPAETAALLHGGACNVLEYRGVTVNPLTRRFHITRDTRVNYMVTAQRRD